jgi:iron complex outermembrane recepter protein
MSELIRNNDNRATIRWKLLTGASALALGAYISGSDVAKAEDTGRPSIWLEVDGQFSQQNNGLEVYDPSFLIASPFDAAAHVDLEKGPPTIWDKGAKITYQPDGSDWIFSLGMRYGKSARSETVNHQTPHASKYSSYYGKFIGEYNAYQIFKAQSAESHAIVDFQVGKDVGLGRFGSGASSVLGAGVRIAQFNSRGAVEILSQPANASGYGYYHIFRANFDAKRRFSGIGPSISWDASANIAGNASSSVISLDWGVNGAVLFGRQSAKTHHETTDNYKHDRNYISISPTSGGSSRSKNVAVPNLGGFAGLSWRTPNAKVSIGYRADVFFGAIDGGIDTAKKENRGFYGPYASISIGLGD